MVDTKADQNIEASQIPLVNREDGVKIRVIAGEADDEELDEEEDTLGGHVTARLGRLAKRGDTVSLGRYDVEVIEVSPRRVERLRITRRPDEEGESEETQQSGENVTPGEATAEIPSS